MKISLRLTSCLLGCNLLLLPLVTSAQVTAPAPAQTPGAKASLGLSGNSANNPNSFGVSISSSMRDGIPPLVVQFSPTEPAQLSDLEVDLNIMNRLIESSLERSLGDYATSFKMGIPMVVSASGRSVRALYIDGFGAMFMVKVGFPVFGPTEKKEPKPETPAADTEWERARRELLGGGASEPTTVTEVQFDPELVATLKKELLTSLTNAVNIRHLKDNDQIAVTVFGGPVLEVKVKTPKAGTSSSDRKAGSSSRSSLATAQADLANAQAQVAQINRSYRTSRSGGGEGTVLTIRVKKSDVTAFTRGTMDFETFQKTAAINAYQGSGYSTTSVNSWSRQ